MNIIIANYLRSQTKFQHEIILAQYRTTKQLCVIKIIPKEKHEEDPLSQLALEIEVRSHIDHPNIVKVYELLCDQTNFYVVSEAVLGDSLSKFLSQRNFIKEDFSSEDNATAVQCDPILSSNWSYS